MTKKAKKVIVVSSIMLFITILAGVCIMTFKNQVFISMPCSYICKNLEKEVPIGTDAENVIAFVKSHDEWTNGQEYQDFYNYEIENIRGKTFCFTGAYSHSYNNINYENKNFDEETDAAYILHVRLGSTPFDPFWGKMVNACFFFDEDQKLVDILIGKTFIGF